MIAQYKIKAYNSKFTLYKIPFSAIERANISLKDKDNSYSVAKHSIEQGWDIGINGAMFSNGNKKIDPFYYWNLTDMIIGGKLNRGGNYSDKGIAFGNDFSNIGAYLSTTVNSNGKPVDFVGGAPTLLIGGKINMDMKGLSPSFASQITQRTALSIDRSNIYIISTLGNKTNLTDVAIELQRQGCLDAIDLDGGGSTSLYADGKSVYTQGRNVTSAFGIKLKKKVIIDSGHSVATSGKRSFDNTLLEYEFNHDVSTRIKTILLRHDIDAMVLQVINSNGSAEINERIRIIDSLMPDAVVSIHANAYGAYWNNANGWEIYCYEPNSRGESYKLAKAIHDSSIPFLGLSDRGIKDARGVSGIVMLSQPTAVLIEHGFYTNKVEVEKLKDSAFRQKCAEADAKGILDYLDVPYIKQEPVNEPIKLYRVYEQKAVFASKTGAEKTLAGIISAGGRGFIKED